MKLIVARIKEFDQWLIALFLRYGHWLHRVSLGILFIWFGLLKPLGHRTTTSILAHTTYWGDPETIVLILGWWEVAIGVCLLFRPLVRIAVLLLVIRLPGVVLAFVLKPEVCFFSFPFAPTLEGQYLIKDLVVFIATLAIVGSTRLPDKPDQYH
jgi:uncharacterized membrane protein YkgB